MDFEFTDEEQLLSDGVTSLLHRHAGVDRARAVGPNAGYDSDLSDALQNAGYLDAGLNDETRIGGAIVVEQVAEAVGCIDIGARSLVAAKVLGRVPASPLALLGRDHTGPVRYAQFAREGLVIRGADVIRVSIDPSAVEPLGTDYGFPLARVHEHEQIEVLPGLASRLESWWRVATAAEITGLMRGALQQTVSYLKDRVQFGHTIASNQAVQHRLADAFLWVESATWLTRKAIWEGATPTVAAQAAGYSSEAAGVVVRETQQLSGAIGFTLEYDLWLWTQRLQVLRREAGSQHDHYAAAGRLRWRGETRDLQP